MGELEEFPKVRRLEAETLLEAVRRQTGVAFVVSGSFDGGQVGAARVRWPDGHEGVLKWRTDFSVEEMKAGGFVRGGLDRAGQQDALVAPPAGN